MSRTLSNPRVDMSKQVLSVSKGGTGTNTAATLADTLKVATVTKKDVPGGVASLDAQGKLVGANVPSYVIAAISGNLSPVVGATTTYEITDYDSFRTYTVSVSAGSVTRNGAIISFTAPSTPQNVTMTVNGRAIQLNVGYTAPATPTISGVAGGGVGSTAVAYLTSSSFSITGTSATHQNTDWQIATDAAFTNIVAQSMADALNKVSWTATGLALSGSFFARNRYRTTEGGLSAWSTATQFTTAASYNNLVETGKFSASDRAASDFFGVSIAVSADSNRVVVGASQQDPSPTTNGGAAYVFVRQGLVWVQEAKLTASDLANSNFLGRSVAIDSTGTRIAVGAPGNNSGATNKGAVYVFTRNTANNTWAQEAKIVASDGLGSDLFGSARMLAIDSSGTRIAVGVSQSDPNISGTTYSNAGAVYVFLRTGTAWAQEAKIVSPVAANSALFGCAIDISDDGSTIIAGATGVTLTEIGVGEQVYTTPGTYTFTVPNGVTSLSMVAIGAGGSSSSSTAGGGGALAYKNNFPVTPGQQFTVVVGQTGTVGNSGGATSIAKVGGGLTINCPGGGVGTGSALATGGDANYAGTNGSYNYSPGAGQYNLGVGGVSNYSNTAGNSPATQANGGTNLGSITVSGTSYTAFGWNNSGSAAALDGSNGSLNRCGWGASVQNGGASGPYGDTGGDGGVRFVWGTNKTYPTSAMIVRNTGAAYIYKRTGTSWAQDSVLTPSSLSTNGQYGISVAISGDGTRAAIGATGVTVGAGTGQVHVFRNNSGWAEETILTGSARGSNDQMGICVSMNTDGSALAIGEYLNPTTFGAAYLYTRTNVTWSQFSKVGASDPVSGSNFGLSLDITGDGLQTVVGAYQTSISSVFTGAFYGYRR